MKSERTRVQWTTELMDISKLLCTFSICGQMLQRTAAFFYSPVTRTTLVWMWISYTVWIRWKIFRLPSQRKTTACKMLVEINSYATTEFLRANVETATNPSPLVIHTSSFKNYTVKKNLVHKSCKTVYNFKEPQIEVEYNPKKCNSSEKSNFARNLMD